MGAADTGRGPTTAGGGVGWRAPRGTPGGGFKYRARFGLSKFLRCLSCRLCPTPETHANPNGDLHMTVFSIKAVLAEPVK